MEINFDYLNYSFDNFLNVKNMNFIVLHEDLCKYAEEVHITQRRAAESFFSAEIPGDFF